MIANSKRHSFSPKGWSYMLLLLLPHGSSKQGSGPLSREIERDRACLLLPCLLACLSQDDGARGPEGSQAGWIGKVFDVFAWSP